MRRKQQDRNPLYFQYIPKWSYTWGPFEQKWSKSLLSKLSFLLQTEETSVAKDLIKIHSPTPIVPPLWSCAKEKWLGSRMVARLIITPQDNIWVWWNKRLPRFLGRLIELPELFFCCFIKCQLWNLFNEQNTKTKMLNLVQICPNTGEQLDHCLICLCFANILLPRAYCTP